MRGVVIIALAAAAGTSELAVTNIIALVLSAGTAAAGVAAYLRARQERPKIIAEAAHIGHEDLRTELDVAWQALDRERHRARARELELARGLRKCERERDALARRVAELERIIAR